MDRRAPRIAPIAGPRSSTLACPSDPHAPVSTSRLTCDLQCASYTLACPVSRPMPYDRPVACHSRQHPLAAALERVGDRWSLLLIEAMLDGPRRFSELSERGRRSRPTSCRSGSAAWKGSWIVRATPYQERPRRLSYALTGEGLELAGALRLLADWGSRGSAQAEPMRHATCGTPVEARFWCPTCAASRGAAGGRRAPLRVT